MANENHVEWLKDGYKAWNERRKLVDFRPQLAGLDFRGLSEPSVGPKKVLSFSRYDLSNADLREAKLSGLNFSKAIFRDADLSGADLSHAYFARARFDRAGLSGVYAVQAVFTEAVFKEADLRGAVLVGSDFSSADVRGAMLPPEELEALLPSTEKRQYRLGPPTGDVMHGITQAPAQDVSPKEPRYLVLFATNRDPIRRNGEVTFGTERGSELSYGSCEVLVPDNHKVGSIGSPFWKRLIRGDDRLKLRRLIPLDGELYWKMVQDNFSPTGEGTPPTVLIHGYSTDFVQSVLWAAQIGYDLGLEKGVSLFSWPSKGSKLRYTADEASVEKSKYDLVDFILAYIENIGQGRLNIIAHSMGCRCLVSALEIIGTRRPEKLRNIGQIILAAADVDQDVMRGMGSHVIGNSGRTTSYACSGDLALAASGWLHSFARVGMLPPLFMLDDIDTVEVEKTDLIGFGHGYVSEAKSILMDMFQLIRHSAPPEERFSVRPASASSPAHWKLRE